MTTERSHGLVVRKWLNCIFFHNTWSDLTYIRQLWSFDIVYPVCVFYYLWPFCWLPMAKFLNDNLHQQGKKTLLHTSREKRLLCTSRERRASCCLKRHRIVNNELSVNMQLKYIFSHHFFLFKEDESLANPCVLAKIDYKKEWPLRAINTHKDKNS